MRETRRILLDGYPVDVTRHDEVLVAGDGREVAIADALPPAAMSLIDGWGPISTTTWQLNVIHAGPSDGWFLLESVADQAADGASAQYMAIWNHDGRAVATATQSVALFI